MSQSLLDRFNQSGEIEDSTNPPDGKRIARSTSEHQKVRKVDFQPVKRMSISLPADTAQALEMLAELQGVSLNEAIRKAIATEAYIQQEVSEGSKILIKTADKEIREVVFR